MQIQLSKSFLLDSLLGVVASFGHVIMLTKVGVKERNLVVQSCSNLILVKEGFWAFWWTKVTLIDMRLCKVITIWIFDLLDFPWIFMKIFPIEIFQILEMGINGFRRFCPIFWTWPCVWNSYIWKIYVHWVSLIFVKYFWNNKIFFPIKDHFWP